MATSKKTTKGHDIYNNANPTTKSIDTLQRRFIEMYISADVGIREFGAAFADAMLAVGYETGFSDDISNADHAETIAAGKYSVTYLGKGK